MYKKLLLFTKWKLDIYGCSGATPRSKPAIDGKAEERGVPVGRTCARATRAYLFARPRQRRASAQTTVARGIRLALTATYYRDNYAHEFCSVQFS
ncbi:unnamed protein product [Colias eurytheme]|nr:unnamed protein product [Colias eurytheme]